LRKLSLCVVLPLLCGTISMIPVSCLGQTQDSIAAGKIETPPDSSAADAGQPASSPSPDAAHAAPAKIGTVAPSSERGKVGMIFKISTLGPGAEVAVSLAHKLNLRSGINFFTYSRGFVNDGIKYNGQLNLHSGELHLDWYPFAHGFHLSPGLLVYNGNGATANASVPGNNTFRLGGTSYLSDPNQPITGKGKLGFNKVAPTLLFGFGNLVPRTRHFSVNFDLGVVFQGTASTTLNLAGNACNPDGTNCVNAATDPNVQASVQSQQRKINNDLSPYKYYPVISLGFGYRF